MNKTPIDQLEAAMKRRLGALPKVFRPFTAEERDLPRALMLTGSRGVGKTTFLLHHAAGRRMLHISADNPLLSGAPLYERVNDIFMRGYAGVIIDEVHFARDWSLHIKALYDDFPDRQIWISDSSSLVLRKGTGDLSRRFVPLVMPLLSFREFIILKTGESFPVFNPLKEVPIHADAQLLDLFHQYRRHGTRPFFNEGSFAERMLSILEKTLHSDVPFFLPRITDDNIRLMNAVVGTLARASIPRLQVRSLCTDWNIGAEKLYQLLFVMEAVGVLRILRKYHDTKAHSAGRKVFFADPAYYNVLAGNPGTCREALAAAMAVEGGYSVYATADESLGDFILQAGDENPVSVEVGGSRKSRKKADIVLRDNTDVPTGNALPLWSLGFLY